MIESVFNRKNIKFTVVIITITKNTKEELFRMRLSITRKKVSVSIISFLTIISLLIPFIYTYNIKANAESKESEPSFGVEINSSSNIASVGQDITISGNIIPNDFTINVPEKDVVLILDISNSMVDEIGETGKTRLEKMNDAVLKFLDSVKDTPNMKISIIAYSSDAFVNPIEFKGITEIWKKSSGVNKKMFNYECSSTVFYDAKSQSDELKKIVDTVVGSVSKIEKTNNGYEYDKSIIEGGTSTGEALRQAHRVLNQSNSKNKSIILMTDGVPSYYSSKSNSKNDKNVEEAFYTDINENTLRGDNKNDKNLNPPYLGGGGSVSKDNVVKNATKYAVKIGKDIKNTTMYTLGYGVSKSKYIEDIHKSIAGNKENLYFKGEEEDITEVFRDIALKISTNEQSNNLVINLNLPPEIQSKDGKNNVDLGEDKIIKYTGNYINNNTQIEYKAEKVPFSFVIKGNTSGTYNLFGENNQSNIKFTIRGKENVLKLPKVSLIVGIPDIQAELKNENDYLNKKYKVGDVIPISYTIKPQNFTYNEDSVDNNQTYDPNGPKDIIFVVDTSSQTKGKLEAIKEALKNKIILNNNNDRFSIITYDSNVQYKTLDNYPDLNQVKNMKNNGISTYSNAIEDIFSEIVKEKTQENNNINESNLLDALKQAYDIFENGRKEKATEAFDKERSKAGKNIIIIGANNVNLNEIKSSNIIEKIKKYNLITLDLGDINKEKRGTNTNLKELQYSFIGKNIVDNETVEDEENNNYYMNINYDNYDKNNPYKIFDDQNNFGGTNWIIKQADRIKNKLLGPSVTTSISKERYEFKAKLKFNLNSNFSIQSVEGSNLNPLENDNNGYTVESNEIPIIYTLNKDKNEYESSEQVMTFKIKILKSGNLRFGNTNNIVYRAIGDFNLTNPLKTPIINVVDTELGLEYGIYKGGININQANENNIFNNKAIVPMAAKFDYTEQDKKVEIELNKGLKNYGKPLIYQIIDGKSLSLLNTKSEFNSVGDKYVCDEIKQPGKYIIVYNIMLDKNQNLGPEQFESIFRIDDGRNKLYTLQCNGDVLPDLF